MKALEIVVSGDVQGVSYRYFAKKKAMELGLSGWARNEHDGTVRIFVQGDEDSLSSFLSWAKDGSPMSVVQSVSSVEAEADMSLKGFEVK